MSYSDFDQNRSVSITETNDRIETAWNLVENTGASLYLTGKAGTGKTTFLRRIVEQSKKRLVVTAPTGIAAINAGGVTLHSFFQLPFGLHLPGSSTTDSRKYKLHKSKISLIRSLDLLIIDEISMVRADLLDAVDETLRRIRRNQLPFGGLQLLLIGDLCQLPPVVKDEEANLLQTTYPSPYFFESKALAKVNMRTIELEKVYRQSDAGFLSLLNEIRSGYPSANALQELNRRYIPGFFPPAESNFIRLTTHNACARNINEMELRRLDGEATTFSARIQGIFPETSFPADSDLTLKVGAQVMFIKNDPNPEKKYYNGLMGKVVDIKTNSVTVLADDSDEPITVVAEEWQNNRYDVSKEDGKITEVLEGSFFQIPLRLAWAVTIHKSQGLTFDRALIDVSRSFAHGQAYVALSRCRTLEGIVLDSPLSYNAIISDEHVREFMNRCAASSCSDREVEILSCNYYIELLDELFSMKEFATEAEAFYRVAAEAHSKNFPHDVEELGKLVNEKIPAWNKIVTTFAGQYNRIFNPDVNGNPSQEFLKRIKDAAIYFRSQLLPVDKLLKNIPAEHPNKEIKKRLSARRSEFSDSLRTLLTIFEVLGHEDFSPALYLQIKGKAAIADLIGPPKSKKRNEKKEKVKKRKISLPEGLKQEDLINFPLYETLVNWRAGISKMLGVPAYVIAYNRALAIVSETLPRDKEQLKNSGLSVQTLNKYGDEILNIVASYQ